MLDTFTTSTNINWTLSTISNKFLAEEVDDNEEIVRLIQVFGRPPIIILGTIGNILTFIAMQRGSLKRLSTCFYMAMLALADTGNNSNCPIFKKLKFSQCTCSSLASSL